MDGHGAPKAGVGKAVPAGGGGAAATPSARAARVRKATSSLPAAADAPAPATAAAGEEEVEDEQVERFYALLDNIRALRGADAGGGATSTSSKKRRLRGSEPPWRPAFRMEDFEEPSPASKRARDREEDAEDGVEPRPGQAVAPASPSPPRAGARLDGGRVWKSI